jgi:uncharacterized protein
MPKRISSLLAALFGLMWGAAAADSCGVPFTLSYKHQSTDLTEEQRQIVQRALAPYQNEIMKIESLLVRTRVVSAKGGNQVPERVARKRAQTVHANIVHVYPELRQRMFVEIVLAGSNVAKDESLVPNTVLVEFMCSRRSHLAKHGVSLGLAAELDWEAALVWVDDRFEYHELRMIALAPKSSIRYDVAFVERGEVRRPISLRRANRREVKRYVQSV